MKTEVAVAHGEEQRSEWGSWPRRVKGRPPPLETTRDQDKLFVPQAPWSARSVPSSSNLSGSPKTPVSSGWHCQQTTPQHLSPLVSRYNSAGLRSLPGSNPATPSNVKLPVQTQLFELPGSLLLPSQGFPPPPATPTRPLQPTRRDTEDSDLGSLPSLTTSISTVTSSSDNMDLLRGLSHTNWRAATNGDSSNKGVNKYPGVTKPFSAMSIDELLDCLHVCDSTIALRVWLPEMRKKCKFLKETLRIMEASKVDSERKLGQVSIPPLLRTT